jgi:hypothetical protein
MADIDEQQPSTLSLMPPDLVEKLARQDLYDLLGMLLSQRSKE